MKKHEREILEAANAGDTEALEDLASQDQRGQRRLPRRDEESPRRGDRQKERRAPKRTLTLETNTEGEKGTMKTSKTKTTKTTKTTPKTQPTDETQPADTTPQNPKSQFNPCAICGHNKSDAKFLVCKADDDRYKAYAEGIAKQIAAGKDVVALSKPEWVLEQLDLDRFEKELEEVRQKRLGVRERALEKAKTAGAGKSLPREVFTSLVDQYEKKESDELYFLVRRLYARLQAAQTLKPDLEKTVAKKATPAEAPTDETTAVPEEAQAEAPAEA